MMGARKASFRQADVTRALRGALKAATPMGAHVRMEIVDGRIVIIATTGESDSSAAEAERRMVEAFGQ